MEGRLRETPADSLGGNTVAQRLGQQLQVWPQSSLVAAEESVQCAPAFIMAVDGLSAQWSTGIAMSPAPCIACDIAGCAALGKSIAACTCISAHGCAATCPKADSNMSIAMKRAMVLCMLAIVRLGARRLGGTRCLGKRPAHARAHFTELPTPASGWWLRTCAVGRPGVCRPPARRRRARIAPGC